MTKDNYTLMCDFYELTMIHGYFATNTHNQITYFDVFYRNIPDNGGYAISAGLEQIVEYIQNLHFTSADLDFLRSKKIFSEAFLLYLKDFHFTGDIYAVPEGTVIFPNTAVMTVKAKAIEAQFIETYVLNAFNYQSLIATKANRIVRAAGNSSVSEFGARRAHSLNAAVLGARAAYIGGCIGTSNTLAGQLYNIPLIGTMAHSWVQMYSSEYEAFKRYCEIYPSLSILLVDTYNVIKSGIPNAIRAFDEVLKPRGFRPVGVRIDSGDIAYLSKQARILLDAAGYSDCKIFASNSLDEVVIRDMVYQGAKIDSYGVGERLITAKSNPVFSGVYKLVAIEEEGKIIPKIKISENLGKITTPHYKKLYRIYDKENNKAIADYITVYDEVVDESLPLELFDPMATWKRKTITNYRLRELQVPIFIKGELVYKLPDIEEIKKYCLEEVNSLWPEVIRFESPHKYYVDLSQKLWDIKDKMLKE